MLQRRSNRLATAVGLVILLAAAAFSLAGAYAEEPIPFRDPYTGQVNTELEISTIHFDLTYVMALAAGFSENDSRTLMIWDQLVDSNVLTSPDTYYTNCAGTFPRAITPRAIATEQCTTPPAPNDEPFWPNWREDGYGDLPRAPGKSCVTSRYGPFEGFFHFAHRTDKHHDGSDPAHYAPEMEALWRWGWGYAQKLKGYQGYVWGSNMSEATGFFGHTCMLTEPVIISTGMKPGSLQAFATYIHSLADSYSHQRCQEKTDDEGWLWPTHTAPSPPAPEELPRIYECNYAPTGALQNIGDSHHGREFGSNPDWADDWGRTEKAVLAVYKELQARSIMREGVYKPLDLDAPLTGKGRGPKLTLREALTYYVEQWNSDEPQARRDYADQLAKLILAKRVPRHR
jgi:hypothetical protein